MIERKTMKQILYSTLLIIFFSLSSLSLNAKHIIGGEVYYDCLGIDSSGNTPMVTFEITFNMYRDCFGGGAGFDSPAQFGLYTSSGNDWNYTTTFTASPGFIDNLEINDDPCVEEPEDVCVQKATYIFNITVPVIDETYLLSYQRCCRNNTIVNIIDPGETGAVFQVEISPLAQQICNDSPTFDNFPPIVVCAETPLFFDHAASDNEGHTLVYEFCTPITSGGTLGSNDNPGDATACNGVTPNPANCAPEYDNVIFKPPNFKVGEPLGDGSNTNLNAFTGLLTTTPQLTGQHVIGVCVKEFLNGELLSEIRRDFQFNVESCKVLINANVGNDEVIKEQEFLIRSCGEFDVLFENLSEDKAFIEEYLWEFNIDGNVVSSDQENPTISFPEVGDYFGQLIINPNSVGCQDTAKLFIEIRPEIIADFSAVYDTCVAGPVEFEDLSVTGAAVITRWEYDLNLEDTVNLADHSFTFLEPDSKNVRLTVEDINKCVDDTLIVIDYFPIPADLVIQPSSFVGCLPADIKFNNLSTPISDAYTINWDFGDGNQDTLISPIHTYEDLGQFSVSLEITSPLGCYTSEFYPFLIQTLESPVADFSYTPDNVSTNNPVVSITDESLDAVSWQYIINDEDSYFQPNITYEFRDTGIQVIDLIVIHPSGCTDTLTQYIDVVPLSSVFMPNAFSPNGDGKNDIFKPKGNFFGVENYSLLIYNRWGQKVFETEEPNVGWNGKLNNVGNDSPTGVYVYKLNYIGPRNKIVSEEGFATIVR